MIRIIVFTFILTLISSCNFGSGEEGATSGGGLFVNNQEVQNVFTISLPSNKTYISGENIDISLTHNSVLSVSGSPRLELSITSGNVYADYLVGSGTNTISFRYTVQPSDQDSNGIEISNTIDLNGGSITIANGDNANTTLPSFSSAGILVGTPGPVVSSFTLPSSQTYIESQTLNFTVTYDQIVNVTSNPRIEITLASGTVYADYSSGSGSTDLIFSYTVSNSHNDLDGISINPTIDLNSGSIQNTSLVDAALTFTPGDSSTVLVDALIPTVTINTPSNINSTNTSAYNLTGSCSEESQNVIVNIGSDTFNTTCSAAAWSVTEDISLQADSPLIAITADIQDLAGNNATQATASVIKDTTSPSVTSNSILASTYLHLLLSLNLIQYCWM